MATVHSIKQSKSCRATAAPKRAKATPTTKAVAEAMAKIFQGQMFNDGPADPYLEILTRSQRLQLADLEKATGIEMSRWVHRAIDVFLETEAPVWHKNAERASRRRSVA
jgi:hypothetical protein